MHYRRGDKWSEAVFYDIRDYFRRADEFYETYFLKNPSKRNTTKKMIYLASDDPNVFGGAVHKWALHSFSIYVYEYLLFILSLFFSFPSFPDYTIRYNNTYVEHASKPKTRYSEEGFLSLVHDLYFMINADYIVCTFSSNICRLAYEILLARKNDLSRIHHSLDMPYYHISDAKYYRMAILKHDGDPELKRGDLVERRMVTGLDYDDYKCNGFVYARNERTKKIGDFPSYKLKVFY